MKYFTKLKQKRWVTFATGLALLILAALLWGLQSTIPVRAAPGNLYVDGASGKDLPTCGTNIAPCQTISYTLNSQASEGDAILIAAGTYSENLTITGITVTLRGGYTISDTIWLTNTGETVIDGGEADRVFFIHDSNSVLENLTISGGAANFAQCWGDSLWVTNAGVTVRSSTIKDNNGGCIAVEVNQDFGPTHLTLESSTLSNLGGDGALHVWGEFASATIVDTTFTENTGLTGSAISVDFGSSAVISNSQIISNTALEAGGGIAAINGSTAIVLESQILSNTANIAAGIAVQAGAWAVVDSSQIHANTSITAGGGGIGLSDAGMNLSRSWVTGNSAPNGQSGGLDLGDNSTVNVYSSVVADNWANSHGGAATLGPGATLNLTNTLVTGNSTTSGNANVFGLNGNVMMMNSTVADNNPQGAQAVILWSGQMTVTNSIMWNNAQNLMADPPCPTCFTVTYSDIEGGWTGDGNINEDPLFVGKGDYHLQLGSPGIDTGTNTAAPSHDLDQMPRPIDGDGDGVVVTDMGAYELQVSLIYLPLTVR